MNDEQNNGNNTFGDSRNAFNWFMAFLEGPGTTLKVFLRYRLGSQQPGLSGLTGLIVIFTFAALGAPYDSTPMLTFGGLYLFVLILRRIGAGARYARGEEEHSYHEGHSCIARAIPVVSETIAVRLLEPMFAFVAGLIAAPYSPPLCGYLLLATFSLVFVGTMRAGIHNRRIRNLRDRYIEQQYLAATFRDKISRFRH